MIAKSLARILRAALAALAIVALGVPARAQTPAQPPPPSAGAIALAKEILTLKGAGSLYDPMVPGVIERAKLVFVQVNPMLIRDLNEVAAKLRAEMSGRSAELLNEAAKLYAGRFTEQELKDTVAFYKSPLGKKVITEEPQIIDASVGMLRDWQKTFADEVMIKFREEMKKKGHDL